MEMYSRLGHDWETENALQGTEWSSVEGFGIREKGVSGAENRRRGCQAQKTACTKGSGVVEGF